MHRRVSKNLPFLKPLGIQAVQANSFTDSIRKAFQQRGLETLAVLSTIIRYIFGFFTISSVRTAMNDSTDDTISHGL
jgi:hypothetical protein